MCEDTTANSVGGQMVAMATQCSVPTPQNPVLGVDIVCGLPSLLLLLSITPFLVPGHTVSVCLSFSFFLD